MSRFRRWTFRIFAALFGLVFLIFLAGFIYEQVGRTEDAKDLPRRVGRAIDLGGSTMNLYCSGEGAPTVIFETGGNESGYSWALIQPRIAAFTRACWYDRAGVGWSDPPLTPRTSTSVISDLHKMLQRAGEFPPYVLVGASIGGEYARIYTARYPADVAGVVLVDATNPDQQEPPFMQGISERMSPSVRHLLCLGIPMMARFGVLRLVSSRMGGPDASQANTEQTDILSRLEAQPKALRTNAEQACAATEEGRVTPTRGSGNPELDNAARNVGSLGDRPLIVLTAGKFWAPAGLEKESAAFHDVWVHQLQTSLVHLSTHGSQTIVDAYHDMSDAPDAVVTAIQQVVEETRAPK
jgi:pimeloyl-ACP methyl ester carboxylesterase